MLKIHNLFFSYTNDKPLYQGLTLSIESNNIIGVLGQNGVGKTTLFNLIYGFLKVQGGTIKWNNKSITKNAISFLETENYFYSYMTAKEYLELITYESKGIKKRYESLFNLNLNEFVDNYSTGMKKKLAFWGVVEQDREIIILDEPFNGIDLESVEFFYHIIRSLKNENRLIIISSHILETLTNVCDSIIYFENGDNYAFYDRTNFQKIETIIKNNIRHKFLTYEEE